MVGYTCKPARGQVTGAGAARGSRGTHATTAARQDLPELGRTPAVLVFATSRSPVCHEVVDAAVDQTARATQGWAGD